jgi:NCAIR mutase (PurE)-related protein
MNDLPAPDSESRSPAAEFVTTHGSVVLAAGQKDLPQAAEAKEKTEIKEL